MQTIDDVELHLDTGGLYALGKLEPGQSKSVRIFLRGEDGMQASFFSVPESKERTTPQMYIDASGGFRPKLTIGKSGSAQWSLENDFLWPYLDAWQRSRRKYDNHNQPGP